MPIHVYVVFVCTCMCVQVFMHVCVHEVRGQTGCFCPLLSTLIFETVFFIDPKAHQFGWTGNQRDPGASYPHFPMDGITDVYHQS